MPTILRPTGRPQLPVPEAQDGIVMFVTDVRALKIIKKKTPCIIAVYKSISGHNAFDNLLQILLYIEGRYYFANSILEAFEQVYKSYWIFFLEFNKAAHNCYHFFMKFFFNMTYVGEKCSPATTKLLKKLYK